MDDSEIVKLDARRPRGTAIDREHVAGALWALQTGLDWCRDELVTIGEPSIARELDEIGEQLYAMTDRLTS